VAVPAVTSSKVKHARRTEAALGEERGRPAAAAALAVVLMVVVVVPRAGSGQR